MIWVKFSSHIYTSSVVLKQRYATHCYKAIDCIVKTKVKLHVHSPIEAILVVQASSVAFVKNLKIALPHEGTLVIAGS